MFNYFKKVYFIHYKVLPNQWYTHFWRNINTGFILNSLVSVLVFWQIWAQLSNLEEPTDYSVQTSCFGPLCTLYCSIVLYCKYISTPIKIHPKALGNSHLYVIESLLCFSFPKDGWGRLCCVAQRVSTLSLDLSCFQHACPISHNVTSLLLLALVRPVPGVPDGTDMTTNVLPDFFAHPCSSVWGDVPGAPAHRPSSSTQFATLRFMCECTRVQPVLRAFRRYSAITTVTIA